MRTKIAVGMIKIHGVPDNVEVLYPQWRYSTTDKPGRYHPSKANGPLGIEDQMWAWVPHPSYRRAFQKRGAKAVEKYGDQCWFRAPTWGGHGCSASPVRIWTGRKWQWYWVLMGSKKAWRTPKVLSESGERKQLPC